MKVIENREDAFCVIRKQIVDVKDLIQAFSSLGLHTQVIGLYNVLSSLRLIEAHLGNLVGRCVHDWVAPYSMGEPPVNVCAKCGEVRR